MQKNPKFNYESDNFLEKIDHNHEKHLSLIPKSTGFISPGDVLRFVYSGQLVNVLVVQIDRGPGIFLSTQDNKLLACFKLDDSSESVLKIIIRSIYKDRGLASYKIIQKSLNSILGPASFRTYNFNKIGNLTKISIEKEKLILGEENKDNYPNDKNVLKNKKQIKR
jgi:hypothetical protein